MAAASRPAACCSTRRARCFATKTTPRIEAFLARHPDALRESLTFAPRSSPPEGDNSCLRSRARATIRTDFSTRCCARPESRHSGGAPARGADSRQRPSDRRRDRAPASAALRRSPACRRMPLPPPALRAGRRETLRRLRARRWRSGCTLVAGVQRAGAGRHDHRSSRPKLRAEEDGVRAQRRVRSLAQLDARGGAAEGRAALLRARVRALSPALVLARRKGADRATQYRVSYNALTRQYRVASGLLAQTFDSLEEVERFLVAGDVAAGRARRPAAARARATTRRCGCGSTSTSCRSRSRSTRSRRASGRCSPTGIRWSFTP